MEQPTGALAHHFTTTTSPPWMGSTIPPYPVGVLCETPPHTHSQEVFQLLQHRIKGQPSVELTSLERLSVERRPIRPGGGTDHLSDDSCFRNTY